MSKSVTVVTLNGPAGSGKDAICEQMRLDSLSNGSVFVHLEIKAFLFNVALKTSGLSKKLWEALYEREYKEVPTPYLQVNGKHVSPRQWMIHCSENVIKPLFGDTAFGDAAARDLQKVVDAYADDDRDLVIGFSDGGFPMESIPLMKVVGDQNYFICRLHREVPDQAGVNYSFAGDSRSYLYPKDFEGTGHMPNFVDIQNINGAIEVTSQKIYQLTKELG